ncbi:Alanyl-tRNA synthetase domain protein [Collimonas arenae]|uniref:Alanyl-tRNA synthetase domain protein n=1 Tax=Collimonas arenae TaxID=279058 RepID=A0A0A1FHB2_9BURK|nr:alanyl-tRNA editing protein [Collimonas arenae]AIY43976.1 Alanyl-tRNA synthetase domain protein [Collimonas arenae]
MVDKLFWQDPYLTALKTKVAAVDDERVRLEETIFFAFSGGQESDAGTIAGHSVLSAEKEGLDIVYTLPAGHGLQAGSDVEIVIDWERRYRLMRLHFAAEMVLQLVYKLRPGIERIGAHISADKARVDFAHEGSIATLFPEIEREAAALSNASRPIVTAFTDEAAQRRYWEVAGFARMACGGTHPRTTAEIGVLKLKRKNTGKGKERIEISLAG